MDDNEKAKLIAARLNQLELGAAEEKDQEVEIGGYMFCEYCDGLSALCARPDIDGWQCIITCIDYILRLLYTYGLGICYGQVLTVLDRA